MTWQTVSAFALLCTVLSFTPGPVVMLTLSQSLAHGARKAVWAILGIVAANFTYFLLSATSIGAILMASYDAFKGISWLGVGFLLWLGLKDIFGKPRVLSLDAPPVVASHKSLLGKGFFLQISNPGAVVFFAAVLPQFLHSDTPLVPQLVILALAGNAVEFLVLTLYALAAERFVRVVLATRYPNILNKVTGGLLIIAALTMAVLR